MAKTVIEVADVAWKAIECHHHHHNHHNPEHEHDREHETSPSAEDELESLRCENRRLRNLLEQNLKLLQNISELPCLPNDCPPDVRKACLPLRFLLIFWSSWFVGILLSVPWSCKFVMSRIVALLYAQCLSYHYISKQLSW